MKKKIALFLALALSVQVASLDIQAADIKVAEEVSVLSGIEVLSQDTIVMKYRIYNGKPQCRRWNATKGCWVDPAWIDMSP